MFLYIVSYLKPIKIMHVQRDKYLYRNNSLKSKRQRKKVKDNDQTCVNV